MPTPFPQRIPARRLARSAAVLLAGIAIAGLLAVLAAPAGRAVPPAGLGGFEAGHLISDAEMFSGRTLDATAIDQRLASLGTSCSSARTEVPCLKDLRVSTPARGATAYCTAIPARADASAGRVIADVSVACGINPKVLIVMLQKEQGLVTTTAPTKRMMDQALGFRCPDGRPCDTAYAGIGNQLYHAASRLREYGDPARGYTYRTGTYLIPYSPNAYCGRASVTIRNRATAALYNYTPFTPTQRALDAGGAAVPDDACATYGNRNFFRIYQQWFGSPTGADPSRPPVAAPLGEAPAAPFPDVPFGVSQFFTEVSWLKQRGLTTGYPDGTYQPLAPISREAMVAFLYRAAGSPALPAGTGSRFTDVSAATTPYWREIEWAAAQGITTGYPDGTFRPGAPVARDAMAAFLHRAAGSPATRAPAVSPFRDVAPGTAFYAEICWARGEGITTGYPDGSFRPLDPISREAMAAFVYRWKL